MPKQKKAQSIKNFKTSQHKSVAAFNEGTCIQKLKQNISSDDESPC